MKIGMNLLLWTTRVTEEHYKLLGRLKEIGYDGVEIPIFGGAAEEYRELAGVLRDLGLGATAVTVLDPAYSPISPDKAVRTAAVDRLKWAIDRCADAGAEILCGPLHSPLGIFSGSAPSQSERNWGIETLQEAAAYAAQAKVELAVEYLNRFESYFLTTGADALKLIKMVNRPACGLMWDTFHAHIEEKEVAPVIQSVSPHLIHVHISENDRGIPGTGQVNWEETFKTLRNIRYDRWLVIEAFSRALPELAAATRVWRDLFENADQLSVSGLQFIRRQWSAAE
jgi:D-psicose/D-tagatose/L-ribulose 3-epimerase